MNASATVLAVYTFTAPTVKAQELKNDRPSIGVIGLGGRKLQWNPEKEEIVGDSEA